jgi:hypothetical protein
MKERISAITEKWFLSEEALFMTFCTHRLQENSGIKCPIRVGKGVIEVNPVLCADMTDKQLEEHLCVEVIRILLKHPYERQPSGCSNTARALGSNCVIGDSYRLRYMDIEHPEDFRLPKNGHYEFYARMIQKMLKNSQNAESSMESGDEASEDLAQNWQQDELMSAQINEMIRDMKSWGSLHGNLVEQIVASTKARIDYRKILAGFRATILSQARKLTRMRPNRRSGFDAMGSRYDFTTSIIIGVDVSGSIRKEDLQNFYTTINRFFQYGIQQIDVVQFDTKIGEVQTLTKASENIKITGRGGTDFQPFINFVAKHPEYDGAIIYTDGYAQQPTIPSSMHTPLCWILRSEKELKEHEKWMSESGRVCVIENND